MEPPSKPELRTSKRKRTQVNYREEPLSDDDGDDFPLEEKEQEEDDVKRTPRAKKRKIESSRPLPKKKIFPFLELPAELRNVIYSHCLHDPAGIYLFSTTKKYRRTVWRGAESAFRGHHLTTYPYNSSDEDDMTKPDLPCTEIRPLVPALLAVCKQINAEARDILYDHEFFVKDTMALHSFMVDLGPRAAGYLKNVTLKEWGCGRGVHKAYNHACFTALSAATNLERFTFHGILSWRRTPKAAATIFYRDAFPWLESVGAMKGRTDAALETIQVMVPDTGAQGYWTLQSRTYRRNKCFKVYDEMEEFRKELGKLLNARMDRIRR